MKREYFSENIENFLNSSSTEILGSLVQSYDFQLEQTQRDAWLEEIRILKKVLKGYEGAIYFEYSIPLMGKRIDVVLLIGPTIFVLEFKIGKKDFLSNDVDQVWDYALDLKNFHESSHDPYIAPLLIATKSKCTNTVIGTTLQNDKLLVPIKCNLELLSEVIKEVLFFCDGKDIDIRRWEQGSYRPTPTIIEAAMALYNGHSVNEISRRDASAKNLNETSEAISKIIRISRETSQKSICFVTGVPGAGKTLIGLNIATPSTLIKTTTYTAFSCQVTAL